MSFTFRLDPYAHDLTIVNGRLATIGGPDQVVQRIKVALLHERGEYFLYRNHGVPWHSRILGSKPGRETAVNYIRNAVAGVEGVTRVAGVSLAMAGREMHVAVRAEVAGSLSQGPAQIDIAVGG